MRIGSVLKHSTQAVLEGALVATLVVGLMAGTALAGKPTGGGGSSSTGTLALVMVTDTNANGSPDRQDSITFTVATTATATPMVGLRCWQGSNWVYDAYVGYFANAIGDKWFALSSDYWAAGAAASCTSRLFYFDNRGREHVLNSMTFGVAP